MRAQSEVGGGNFCCPLPTEISSEIVEIILKSNNFRLERIISHGQATPAGEWYDQEEHEWVLVVSGRAGLVFEDNPQILTMGPGDYLHIPAHCRHRVAWTDPGQPTIWLALHYRANSQSG